MFGLSILDPHLFQILGVFLVPIQPLHPPGGAVDHLLGGEAPHALPVDLTVRVEHRSGTSGEGGTGINMMYTWSLRNLWSI